VYLAHLGDEATGSGKAGSPVARPSVHVDMSRPTKGLRVNFAYGVCGIRRVNVLD